MFILIHHHHHHYHYHYHYHHHPSIPLPTYIHGEWGIRIGTASIVLALQSTHHSHPVRTGLAQQTTRRDSGYILPLALAVRRKMGEESGRRKEGNHNEDEYQAKW